ncbi:MULTISPECIES: carbohydrate ABC transporter permease [unclassified Curtobacterium]|uniref:carbohydrate ABC transporter permease n=1 Tax=unclassified Curtobacterium TaxID=257496 RepID=UPI003A80DBC3
MTATAARATIRPENGHGQADPNHLRRQPSWRRSRQLKGAMFTLPFALGFLAVFVLPLVWAVVQSVFTVQKSGAGFGGAVTVFAGFSNYLQVFHDSVFWASVLRVLLFACVQIPVMLALSLVMALLLDAFASRAAGIFRIGLLIPHMVPGIVAALIWLYLYSPNLGPLHSVFGIDFYGADVVFFSIGNLLTWSVVGFNMLIIYGALRGVPRDLFEAARLDGAGEFRIAWSIKIPYVRGSLVLTGMLAIIAMLQIFNEPLVFRTATPQTVTSQFTPIMAIFNQAFTANNYNYAAALSVVLAVVVGIVSAVFYRLTNRSSS